ncbi:Xaa-Pro peptidase family protein [uncultured Maricaulis sp.]|uniref:M24 family metallopeptidase n=1 Tax=uncultured Maricaulis sp. TaxID=174710 RepID=UPI0030DCDDF6|tara:strand:- start:151487 stop:152689 length:1203 start_codon:yes stop_codon:yes gene_type:complete
MSNFTRGVGGSTAAAELARLKPMLGDCQPISHDEHRGRLTGLAQRMAKAGVDAVWLDAGSNLTYYTGMKWRASERLVGALVNSDGGVTYVGPAFEEGTLKLYMGVEAPLRGWEEHESPYACVASLLPSGAKLGIDPATPYFTVTGLSEALGGRTTNAGDVILFARARKSAAELALMQATKTATIEVHKAAGAILRPGITTGEVTEFIHAAHKKIGAPGGSTFCIVLFGPDTAFPHGVARPKTLDKGDVVLIDTGCAIHGYQSDITRTYVFGEPTARQREVWDAEKACQIAALAAAQLGQTCASVDAAARAEAEARGFGPGYQLPGIPHRTGHGIGLDIHEAPYLVGGDETPLDIGMCFSNEPMICVPGEFGIRLEDHFYMTAEGPRWFTEPSKSIEDPFG